MGSCQCSVDLSVQLITCVFHDVLFNCPVVWANNNVCICLYTVITILGFFLLHSNGIAPQCLAAQTKPVAATSFRCHQLVLPDFLYNIFGITVLPAEYCYSLRPKAWKSTFSITALMFDAPSWGNTREYPHKPYIARIQSYWATSSFADNKMGLSSFKFSWWTPKDACVLKQSA